MNTHYISHLLIYNLIIIIIISNIWHTDNWLNFYRFLKNSTCYLFILNLAKNDEVKRKYNLCFKTKFKYNHLPIFYHYLIAVVYASFKNQSNFIHKFTWILLTRKKIRLNLNITLPFSFQLYLWIFHKIDKHMWDNVFLSKLSFWVISQVCLSVNLMNHFKMAAL